MINKKENQKINDYNINIQITNVNTNANRIDTTCGIYLGSPASDTISYVFVINFVISHIINVNVTKPIRYAICQYKDGIINKITIISLASIAPYFPFEKNQSKKW